MNSTPAEPKEKVEISIFVVKPGQKVFATGNDEGQPWDGDPDRRFEFVGRELEYRIGPKKSRDINQVGRWLVDFYRKDPEAPATIDCRPGTVYGDMVPVLDAVVDAEFTDVTFVGEYKTAAK